MKVWYMAHPVGGDVLGNVARAKRWLRWLQTSYPAVVVIAPWLEAIEIIGDDDSDPIVRERSLLRDAAVAARCDVVVLVGGRISPGMQREADAALGAGGQVFDLTPFGPEPPVRA